MAYVCGRKSRRDASGTLVGAMCGPSVWVDLVLFCGRKMPVGTPALLNGVVIASGVLLWNRLPGGDARQFLRCWFLLLGRLLVLDGLGGGLLPALD
jgi:hypothetical protein